MEISGKELLRFNTAGQNPLDAFVKYAINLINPNSIIVLLYIGLLNIRMVHNRLFNSSVFKNSLNHGVRIFIQFSGHLMKEYRRDQFHE